MFGEDARAFAKGGMGSPNFWFNFAVSSMYFSGLLEGVNYICSYPGRAFIEAAGGRARLFSWLKTINAPYTRINSALDLAPFKPNGLENEPLSLEYDYFVHVVANDAPGEIHESLCRYRDWKWA